MQNVRTTADTFGGVSDVYQGFDVTVNARFGNGTFIQGGVNAQKRHQDYCNAPIVSSVPGVTGTTNLQADNPAAMQQCSNAAMQQCSNAGMQECRNAGMQECRNAGMQECRHA